MAARGDHACRVAPPQTGCPAISSRESPNTWYHPIPHKYHVIHGRNRLIPREYHTIRGRNCLIHDRHRMIPREYHTIRG
uniref:Uncharacterized protein n=1 Tax=Oryza nivara TaxID=4536 RepID=A0A0E0HIX2_ORYNI